jgi:hypothetical protein
MKRNSEQTEVRECFLSFGAESFVFQVATQKYKYQIKKNEMGGVCGTYGGKERGIQDFGRET